MAADLHLQGGLNAPIVFEGKSKRFVLHKSGDSQVPADGGAALWGGPGGCMSTHVGLGLAAYAGF